MNRFDHPVFDRRVALQAGAVGLLGLGLGHVPMLRGLASPADQPSFRGAKAVIFIFLSGGLSQHESFDPKPEAPDTIRGEFGVIPTRTTGLFICEHLPRLAACSHLWTVVRSLTHPSNDHSAGHHIMLTGRSDLPLGFTPDKPQPTDHPSIAALVGTLTRARNNLPPAIVLPEKLIHTTGRVIPGQFAGILGRNRDPWFLEASPFEPRAYGAFPQYEFDHQQRSYQPKRQHFVIPDLSLPQDVDGGRFQDRLALLRQVDAQRRALETTASVANFGKPWSDAVNLLTQERVRSAFDLRKATPKELENYGDNSFGWSLWIAARLVEAGVSLVQVNLGNNETWDTHGNAFPHLKEKLLPPMDRSVSALLMDLQERGLLADTLVVLASEFGRTPKISTLTQFYKGPGRDHWGAVQSVLLAGMGFGGKVIGASDRIGGYPIESPCTPENLAATIYAALGLPRTLEYHDSLGRPFALYHGDPIPA
jgi:hypothetical protein